MKYQRHNSTKKRSPARMATMAFVIGSVLLLTTACGSAEPVPTATPVASASAVATDTVTPSAVASPANQSALAGTVINGLPTKKELAKNSKGSYIQTTIADDDPALTYNQAIVDTTAFKYTPEEIAAIQKQFVTFAAEEVIDSTLNDMPTMEDRKEWYERNKEKVEPSYQEDFQVPLFGADNTRLAVFIPNFRHGYQLKYGEDVTHVASRDITLTRVSAGEIGGMEAILFEGTLRFALNAQIGEQTGQENTTGTLSITYVKVGDKWLMSGYNNAFSTAPLM